MYLYKVLFCGTYAGIWNCFPTYQIEIDGSNKTHDTITLKYKKEKKKTLANISHITPRHFNFSREAIIEFMSAVQKRGWSAFTHIYGL